MRSMNGWAWRIGGAIGVIWLVGVALLAPSSIGPSDDHEAKVSSRLQKAQQELDLLKRQNEDMKKILQEFTKQMQELNKTPVRELDGNSQLKSSVVVELQRKLDHAQRMLQQTDNPGERVGIPDVIPSLDYEKTRRLLTLDIQETWFYLRAQLKDLRKKLGEASPLSAQLDQILFETGDRIRVSKLDLEQLADSDGLQIWREKEASELSELVQKRLHILQNPSDCAHARKLVCNLNKGCGYGCQIHHVVYCFIVAYGSQRTLILKSKSWRYNHKGWEDVFKPVSKTCTDSAGLTYSHWPGVRETQVLELPIIDTLTHRPSFLPLSIPEDLSERIIRFHGNPAAWWVGQFLKFLLSPQPKTQQMLDNMKEKFGFKHPIVGVHIRRTDKIGTEAAFHSVEEYMDEVEEYYKTLSLSQPHLTKRVFLASDDPKVLSEAKRKYPSYEILGDPNISQTAAVDTRYSDSSLHGIIADIHFLSLTDYLVCTFSSQVCRIAYEIMQNIRPDGAYRFRSLDDIYYFGGQNPHIQRARFSHTPSRLEEMAMEKGDVVGVAGNHWNGYSKGVNQRTRKTALYPSFKMEEIVDVAKVPSFSDFDRQNESKS